jgi:hypothetical protein
MVALNNPHGVDQRELVQEIARHEAEVKRRKQHEREAYVRNLEAASRLIEAFNHHAREFKKSAILYRLDNEKPPFAPTICLFRRDKPQKPEMTFIPVIVGGPYGTFSLRTLRKRKKRETLTWVTDHTKYYDEIHTRLSDDAQEAANEILARLSKQALEFNSLWEFDTTMGMCARRYFAMRRTAVGLGFFTLFAIAAMCLYWIAQRGW